jgi:hypothetical protein
MTGWAKLRSFFSSQAGRNSARTRGGSKTAITGFTFIICYASSCKVLASKFVCRNAHNNRPEIAPAAAGRARVYQGRDARFELRLASCGLLPLGCPSRWPIQTGRRKLV